MSVLGSIHHLHRKKNGREGDREGERKRGREERTEGRRGSEWERGKNREIGKEPFLARGEGRLRVSS